MGMQLVEKIKQEIEEELDRLDSFGIYKSTKKYDFDENGNIICGTTELGTNKLAGGIGFKEDNNYFIDERRYAILDLIEKYSKSEKEVNTKGISSKYVLEYAVVENDIANRILKGQRVNLKSELIVENGFIGKGMYFSEGNYRYAKEHANNNKLVIGAVINKGNTLDFTNGSGQVIVNEYYKRFIEKFQREPIDDVEFIEELVKDSKIKYDTIKSLAIKGNKLYANSSIHQGTSNIICVRKDACIVEWFNPNKESVKDIIEKYGIQI